MAISALDVKSLRDRTGAGMADCKKALDESNGDMEVAIEILRKKGAATAAKRADKAANEGVVATAISDDHHRAAIVEVNCETDFVARNEEFSTFTRKLAQYVLETRPASTDDLLAGEIDGKTVQTWLNELLGKFSERIEIKRFSVLATDGFVSDYVHNGDKLGVLIEMSGTGDASKTGTLPRDLAMQVAAMNPAYVRREDVPEDVLAKEKEIYMEQVINEGKKPEFAEKIITGRLEKFFADACLLEQTFVKDSTKQIREVLADVSKEIGGDLTVISFLRYNLGEASKN
ncbi:MAG TPA: translation elongation factor Ts [Candidatus Kapabacteria bacterium]|nr:translation elongation factor Ts [Candidatus Kapabacteria bacterium]